MNASASPATDPFVLAIVPARGGSKGLPRKNVLSLGGRPMIEHTLAAAEAAQTVSRVIVNTDDDEIANVAERRKCEVVRRPTEMGSDAAKVDPLLIWTIDQFEQRHRQMVDIVVLLYPTSPLRPASAIDATVSLVSAGRYDSALTLVEDSSYLWAVGVDGSVKPTNYDPARRAPRQSESWNQWRENKSVYVVRRDLLVESGCRLGGRIGHHVMSSLQSLDVDSADDLAIAAAVLDSGRVPHVSKQS